jgi:hypothetical protein
MDAAVEQLCFRENTFFEKLVNSITEFFTEEEKKDDALLKWFCFQLLSTENPLLISPHNHASFWRKLKIIAGQLPSETQHTEFSIIFGNAEAVLHFSYYYGLVALIRTLVDPELHRQFRVVSELPQVILVAFLQRENLRQLLFKKIFANVEDSVNVHRLYRVGYITSVALQDVLENNYRLTGENCYETPPPEQYHWAVAPPPCMELEGLEKPVFPERRPYCSIFANPLPSLRQRNLLAGLYSLLWSNFTTLIPEFVKALEESESFHAEKCRCRGRTFNIDFLVALAHAFLTQNLDERTLARPASIALFNSPLMAPVLKKIENTVASLRAWMFEMSGGSLMEMHVEQHELWGRNLKHQLRQSFPKSSEQFTLEKGPLELLPEGVIETPRPGWQVIQVVEWPVQFLLDHMDINFSFMPGSAKLRSFLAGKVRSNFLAYLMERTVSLPHMEETLLLLKNKYKTFFPQLFASYVVVNSLGKVFLVAEPLTMNSIRLLLVLETATPVTQPRYPVRNEFYGNIFMKHFASVHPSPEAKRLAIYCTVSYLAYLLGGTHLRKLVVSPLDDAAYKIYELLPQLLYHFPTVENPNSHKVICAFVALKHEREISSNSIATFLEATETSQHVIGKIREDLVKALNHKKGESRANLRVRDKFDPCGWAIYRAVLTEDYVPNMNDRITILESLHLSHTKIQPVKYPKSRVAYTPQEPNPTWEVDSETEIHRRNTGIYNTMKQRDCHNVVNYTPQQLKALSRRHFAVRCRGAVTGQLAWSEELEKMNAVILSAEWYALRYSEDANYTRSSVGQLYNNQHRPRSVFLPTVKQPVRRGPVYFFEDVFYVYINLLHWPQKKTYKNGYIHSTGDRAVLDPDIFITMLFQYNTDWEPGKVTKDTAYELEKTEYVQCIRDWQATLKPLKDEEKKEER